MNAPLARQRLRRRRGFALIDSLLALTLAMGLLIAIHHASQVATKAQATTIEANRISALAERIRALFQNRRICTLNLEGVRIGPPIRAGLTVHYPSLYLPTPSFDEGELLAEAGRFLKDSNATIESASVRLASYSGERPRAIVAIGLQKATSASGERLTYGGASTKLEIPLDLDVVIGHQSCLLLVTSCVSPSDGTLAAPDPTEPASAVVPGPLPGVDLEVIDRVAYRQALADDLAAQARQLLTDQKGQIAARRRKLGDETTRALAKESLRRNELEHELLESPGDSNSAEELRAQIKASQVQSDHLSRTNTVLNEAYALSDSLDDKSDGALADLASIATDLWPKCGGKKVWPGPQGSSMTARTIDFRRQQQLVELAARRAARLQAVRKANTAVSTELRAQLDPLTRRLDQKASALTDYEQTVNGLLAAIKIVDLKAADESARHDANVAKLTKMQPSPTEALSKEENRHSGIMQGFVNEKAPSEASLADAFNKLRSSLSDAEGAELTERTGVIRHAVDTYREFELAASQALEAISVIRTNQGSDVLGIAQARSLAGKE